MVVAERRIESPTFVLSRAQKGREAPGTIASTDERKGGRGREKRDGSHKEK